MMSRFLYLSRRAILQWNNWRSRKAMHRAYPELRELHGKTRKCRHDHRKGAARYEKEAWKVVNSDMAASRPDLAAMLFPDEKQADRVREGW